jgi:hypothetical protein
MNRVFSAVVMCSLLAACQAQQDAAHSANSAADNSSHSRTAEGPAGEPFQTPLPAGVVLRMPYNAKMDIPQPGRKGLVGRRTEFEYLEGDAPKAMSEFASAMATAGFVSMGEASNENGVVRQIFKKPGYGAVFARAQAEDAQQRKHPLARGFVVVAWPQNNG